jgi:hypothetical protein
MRTPSLFPEDRRIELHVTLDWSKQRTIFDWRPYHSDEKLAHGAVWVADEMLQWRITGDGEPDNFNCPIDPLSIEVALRFVARRFPVAKSNVTVFGRRSLLKGQEKEYIGKFRDPWQFLAWEILRMGEELVSARSQQYPPPAELGFDPEAVHQLEKRARREEKKRLEREAIQKRIAEANKRNQKRKLPLRERPRKDRAPDPATSRAVLPMPDVRLEIATAQMPSHDLFRTHAGIEDFLKIERASLIWVSNQSDDLLCLPYCSIDQLEYQVRTALRVTGTLRGRALLSDEVGLGKTIEAGLVLKEYVTRNGRKSWRASLL